VFFTNYEIDYTKKTNVSYVKMALKIYQNNVSYVTFFRQPYFKINKTHTLFLISLDYRVQCIK